MAKAGRPKGSKSTVKGHKNYVLAKRIKRAEFISDEALRKYNDPNSTPEEKAEAWKTHLAAEERLTNIGLAQNKLKEKELIHPRGNEPVVTEYNPANDSEPACTCGGLQFCSSNCPHELWEVRQYKYRAEHPELAPTPTAAPVVEAPKIEPPKPAPVLEDFLNDLQLDAWAEPAPVVRKPVVARTLVAKIPAMPKITPEPDPNLSPTDAFLWKHFGNFIRQFGGVLDADVRRGCIQLVNANPGLKMEFASITETMVAPVVVSKPLTDAERTANEIVKQKSASAPVMTDAAYARQEFARNAATETVDEARKRTGSTMCNVTRDSGVSVPLDQRGYRTSDQVLSTQSTMVSPKDYLTSVHN